MPRYFQRLIFISLLLQNSVAGAQLCKKWSPESTLGYLNAKTLPEASGVAAATEGGLLYWINDSGNKATVQVTRLSGERVRTVELRAPRFRDTEALALTRCGDKPCLLIFDTGDNYHRRKELRLAAFLENDLKGESAAPTRDINFQLEGGARDIEGALALPNGDLILFSKEYGVWGTTDARVYKIPFADWWNRDESAEALVAKEIGRLPMGRWLTDKNVLAKAITDAAYNSRRQVIGLLTYSSIVEISVDGLMNLAKTETWTAGQDYSVVKMKALPQQETLMHLRNEDSWLWSSEAYPPRTPVLTQTCEKVDDGPSS